MATLMTRLVVQCPRGQRPETFHDRSWAIETWASYENQREVQVYSYKVLSGNVLKVYAHTVTLRKRWGGDWDPNQASEGIEVAHFRPNQWDKVRSGA